MTEKDKIHILREALEDALDSHCIHYINLRGLQEEYDRLKKILDESEAWIEEKPADDLTTAEDVV